MGLPGYVSEGASREHFKLLENSIASHCLQKQVQCLKLFIEWPKSFPLALLALLAKLGYRNDTCIFVFHYIKCLALYGNTFFLPLLALLVKLGYSNNACIFIFHYTTFLVLYWNTFFLPLVHLHDLAKYLHFEICFIISHSHLFLSVHVVCIISISINLPSVLIRHILFPLVLVIEF